MKDYPITTQTKELFESENREERRSPYNFMDASFEGLDGRTATTENSGVSKETGNTIEGKQTEVSDIDTSNPLRSGEHLKSEGI